MICWSDKSRYGDDRKFSFDDHTGILEVVCYNSLYYSFNLGKDQKVVSVDPDGGPYMGICSKLFVENNVIVIDEILENEYNKKSKKLFVKIKAHKL